MWSYPVGPAPGATPSYLVMEQLMRGILLRGGISPRRAASPARAEFSAEPQTTVRMMVVPLGDSVPGATDWSLTR